MIGVTSWIAIMCHSLYTVPLLLKLIPLGSPFLIETRSNERSLPTASLLDNSIGSDLVLR